MTLRPEQSDGVRTGSTQLVSPIRFSTDELPPGQRSDAWRSQVEVVADITSMPAGGSGSQVEVDQIGWHLGDLVFVTQHSTAEGFRRDRPGLSAVDHWLLIYRKSGAGTVISDDTTCATGAHALELRSLARPFVGVRTETRVSYMVLPRDRFPDMAASLDSLHNSAIEGPLAAMLKTYMSSLESNLDNLAAMDVPRVAQATRAMISACVVPSRDRLAEADSAMRQTLLERARQYVRANLRSPVLTPTSMARALRLSRTQLYRLFENQGGVARYIRRQRLRACQEALALGGVARSIKDLAYEFGFTNPGEFSRSFRAEFGFSPSEARESSQGGQAAFLRQAEPAGSAANFRNWLLGLGQ